MKFITWNVNGLRACIGKGFWDFFNRESADFFCVQETKMQEEQISFELEGYTRYFNSAVKKGYSGTAVFVREGIEPLSVAFGVGGGWQDDEGRVITLELPNFYLVNCYTPNAQRELTRLSHRVDWEDAFRAYLLGLDAKKPVLLCGDLNVAHKEIDLKNYKTNRGNAGFTDEERGKFTELLEAGFCDIFRELYPDRAGAYTWWSYMFKARENNAGWRIDYFVASKAFMPRVDDCVIHADIYGSDHCPVGLIIRD